MLEYSRSVVGRPWMAPGGETALAKVCPVGRSNPCAVNLDRSGFDQPNTVCERMVDFMSIYPTLTELASVPTPDHAQAKSIRPLLADPNAEWSDPAVTTHGSTITRFEALHSVRQPRRREGSV
jgi:arylsulfatase A-like enzyme